MPLIDIKGLDFVHDKIEEMIKVLLDCNIDNQVKNETLLYHLHVYYYLHNEGRIKAQKMTSLNPRIHATLNSYIDYLKKNKEPKVCAIRNAIELIQSRGGL